MEAWAPKDGSKVDTLIKAMREVAETQPVWTQSEAAKTMNVPRTNVPAYIAGACNAGAMFRRTLAHGAGIELSLKQFEALPTPTFSSAPGFVPAPMTAPRAGSDVRLPSRAPGAPPAAAPEPAPEPTIAAAEAPEPVSEPELEADEVDEVNEVAGEPEPVPFDFCSWKDGGLQVWGAEQYEDGSFKITAQQLWAIRKATAWMQPPREEVTS